MSHPPARPLLIAAILVTLVSLLVAPLACYIDDMRQFWVPWQLATAGFRPWGAYDVAWPFASNYPPVVLYALSLMESARSLLHIDPAARLNWILIKFPNILAQTLGGLLLYRMLLTCVDARAAARVALGWICSLAFFVNAAVWGQFDVLLTLAMLLAVLAAAGQRWALSGVCFAIALATKVQAVFIIPALGMHLLLVGRPRGIARFTLAFAIALVALFLPFALAGYLPQSLAPFPASVGSFPFRSMNAWNPWLLANGIEMRLLHRPGDLVRLDSRILFAGFTHKHLGQLLLALYTLAIAWTLHRDRSPRRLLEAAPMLGLAMFMLATQMHERYSLPVAALMTPWLLLDKPYRLQWLFWTLSATLNQSAVLFRAQIPESLFQSASALGSVLNLVAFLHASYLFFRPRLNAKAAQTVSTIRAAD